MDQLPLFDAGDSANVPPTAPEPDSDWYVEVTPDDGTQVWYMGAYRTEEEATFFSRHLTRSGETHRIVELF